MECVQRGVGSAIAANVFFYHFRSFTLWRPWLFLCALLAERDVIPSCWWETCSVCSRSIRTYSDWTAHCALRCEGVAFIHLWEGPLPLWLVKIGGEVWVSLYWLSLLMLPLVKSGCHLLLHSSRGPRSTSHPVTLTSFPFPTPHLLISNLPC